MTPTVTVRGLTVEFTDGDDLLRPLDGLDLEAYDGELVLLLGPSGSGKTTLLSCLAGLLTPVAGTITTLGRDVLALQRGDRDAYRRDTVGVVFQAFNLIGSLSALENVAIPMRLAKVPQATARRRAAELLDTVGLSERLSHKPSQLSGGQQQRVAIARALAMEAPVILADEPTAHLDVVQVDGIIALLRGLASPGRTVIVSTHDDRLIPLADRVIELGIATPAATESGTTEHYRQGQLVFTEGSRSREVYVVTSGAVEVFRCRADSSEERLNLLRPGAYFGEIGPLLSLPRNASARAVIDSSVQVIDVRDFRHSLGEGERRRQRASSLGQELLSELPPIEVSGS